MKEDKFLPVEESREKIRNLMSNEPLVEIIRERFKFEITQHLASLKHDNKPFESGVNKELNVLRKKYTDVGKEFAVTQLVFDVSEQAITIDHLLLLNEIIFGKGEFRQTDVFVLNVSGDELPTPDWQNVPVKLQDLITWYNKEKSKATYHPIELASKLHHRFTVIHPFVEGNGRIARLILNIALMQHGYLPVLIDPGERQEYYEALEKADAGNLNSLVDFMAQKQVEMQEEFMQHPDFLSIQAKMEMESQVQKVQGSEKCIVLTEDSATDHLLGSILEASGFNLNETNIISYEGCSKLSSANLFSIFIREKMPKVKLIVHRDRDYLTDREIGSIKSGFEKIGAHFFVTKGTDVESHFVNAHHIHACHPQIPLEKAKHLVHRVQQSLIRNSVDYLRKKEFGGYRPEKYSHLNDAIVDIVVKNPARFTHGKTALKSVEQKIRRQFHIKSDIEKPSQFLKIGFLERLAKEVWGD